LAPVPPAGTISRMTEMARESRRAAARPYAARRLVGFERHYRCGACGGERRSWTRLSACPDCGTALPSAVIRRAAFVS
jgi:hypothetical protein